jgi:hypothetical protein
MGAVRLMEWQKGVWFPLWLVRVAMQEIARHVAIVAAR